MIKLFIHGQARGPSLTATRAAAGAMVAAALALSACGAAIAPSQRPTGSPAGTRTSASASPAPSPSASISDSAAGFQILSMTFVSDTQGFALGTIGCGSGRCGALVGTSDGGASWHRLTAPTIAAGGVYDTCPTREPCVQQVRFATPLVGYAFGPSLLITTDGGLSWRQLHGPDVGSLEAADGTVDRVASPSTGCAGQRYQVESTPVGTTEWRTLAAPPIPMICPPVLYRQGERLVLVNYGNPAGGVRATAQIDRSSDGGRTWASGRDSCGGNDGYASGVALAPPDVLVLLCQHQMPGPSGFFGPAWIRVSTDGGTTFGPDQTVSSRSGSLLRYQIAAASAGRVLIAETSSHGDTVVLTENGGNTWSSPLSMRANGTVVLVGYQDPHTARVAQSDTVWTTQDGGRTWTADHFSVG